MERDLQACSKEVQQVYGGEQAVQKIIDNCLASRDSSATDVTPVVQAILHALLNSQPASRYPVHGTTGPVDWGIVSNDPTRLTAQSSPWTGAYYDQWLQGVPP